MTTGEVEYIDRRGDPIWDGTKWQLTSGGKIVNPLTKRNPKPNEWAILKPGTIPDSDPRPIPDFNRIEQPPVDVADLYAKSQTEGWHSVGGQFMTSDNRRLGCQLYSLAEIAEADRKGKELLRELVSQL